MVKRVATIKASAYLGLEDVPEVVMAGRVRWDGMGVIESNSEISDICVSWAFKSSVIV